MAQPMKARKASQAQTKALTEAKPIRLASTRLCVTPKIAFRYRCMETTKNRPILHQARKPWPKNARRAAPAPSSNRQLRGGQTIPLLWVESL